MITEFQKKVYKAVKRIPRGRVSTYKHVAEHAGCRSPRAVGQALKKNPYAPAVPCHRVIASDMTIGGYKGQTSGSVAREKLALLMKEGVEFADGRLCDPGRVHDLKGK